MEGAPSEKAHSQPPGRHRPAPTELAGIHARAPLGRAGHPVCPRSRRRVHNRCPLLGRDPPSCPPGRHWRWAGGLDRPVGWSCWLGLADHSPCLTATLGAPTGSGPAWNGGMACGGSDESWVGPAQPRRLHRPPRRSRKAGWWGVFPRNRGGRPAGLPARGPELPGAPLGRYKRGHHGAVSPASPASQPHCGVVV